MSSAFVISTIGSRALDSTRELRRLCEGGSDMLRLNFSHTAADEAEGVVQWARRNFPQIKLLQDLQGAKLRVGRMRQQRRVSPGDQVVFVPQKVYDNVDPRERDRQCLVPVNAPFPFERLEKATDIRMKDGSMQFRIERRLPPEGLLICEVVVGGMIRAEKGLNAPGVDRSGVGLPQKDVRDLALAAEMRFDAVMASFVTGKTELLHAREILAQGPAEWKPQLWAKVECREALDNLDEIIEYADAILIGQGDLGGELGTEALPAASREIAQRVVAAGKPCSIGTGLLESMRDAPTATEAEIQNLREFMELGVRGFLLTAETSVGQHPVEAIQTVRQVAAEFAVSQQ